MKQTDYVPNQEKTSLTIDGGVTEQQIQQWKAQHGKVIRIDVVEGEECHIGYFKRPSLETMRATASIGKTDEFKSSEVMFDNCWLGGSEYLRKDAVLFLETVKQLSTLFQSCMSSIKNL